MNSSVKIFSGQGSLYLAEEMAKAFGSELGQMTLSRFSDGEMAVCFEESVRGSDVFLVQSTFPPAENLMEMLLMIDAARRASAAYVTAVIPYFGYARQDRKDKPRVSIAAKLVANLLSAAGADRVMTCDLHADQIQGFFDVPVDHLDGASVLVPYVQSLGLDNLVIASPDVGGVKRARGYAKILGAELVICDKHRKRANQIESMQLIGDVEGANVVLIDDLIDTGGTLARAAELIREKGALSVRAIATHPILSGNAYETLEKSVLEEVVVTNTIPLRQDLEKIKVLNLGPLFAKAVRRIHDYESISSLFIQA